MMPHLDSTGKLFMIAGTVLFLLGFIIFVGGRFFKLGRLPGDILVQRGSFTFYFPILTCIILSIILSFVISLFRQ